MLILNITIIDINRIENVSKSIIGLGPIFISKYYHLLLVIVVVIDCPTNFVIVFFLCMNIYVYIYIYVSLIIVYM